MFIGIYKLLKYQNTHEVLSIFDILAIRMSKTRFTIDYQPDFITMTSKILAKLTEHGDCKQ